MAQKRQYENRLFGPTTIRRDYSISQKVFETPDFLEMQRTSLKSL